MIVADRYCWSSNYLLLFFKLFDAIHQPNYTALLTCATGRLSRPSSPVDSQPAAKPDAAAYADGMSEGRGILPPCLPPVGSTSTTQARAKTLRGSFIYNPVDCRRCGRSAVGLVLLAVGRADLGASRSGSPTVRQVGIIRAIGPTPPGTRMLYLRNRRRIRTATTIAQCSACGRCSVASAGKCSHSHWRTRRSPRRSGVFAVLTASPRCCLAVRLPRVCQSPANDQTAAFPAGTASAAESAADSGLIPRGITCQTSNADTASYCNRPNTNSCLSNILAQLAELSI